MLYLLRYEWTPALKANAAKVGYAAATTRVSAMDANGV
jgi:hypothetical protein